MNFNFAKFKPKTKEELLAVDIATEFNDLKSLPLYISYCKKYPEPLIRRVFEKVKETPLHKIKKSRGALFNYLIQKHVQGTNQNLGD